MNKKEERLSIKEVSSEFGFSEVYIRRSISKKKLRSTKVQIAKNTFKHLISREDIAIWRANLSTSRRREDGRNKYTLYANKDEFEKITKLLKDSKIESIVVRTNKVKS